MAQHRHRGGPLAAVVRFAVLALLVLVALASFVPLLGSNAWWARYPDFARLQLAVVLVVLVLASLAAGAWRSVAGWSIIALGLAALGSHATKLLPYTPVDEVMAVPVESCPAGSRLDVMVANVLYTDENAERLIAAVREIEPDLLLVLETTAWWDEALQTLHDAYPHHVQHIPEDAPAYGMHLLSRLPLVEPRIEFWFDTITPTAVTGVALPGGGTVRLLGLHPRPPLPPDQSSTMRDAHLLKAALEARGSEIPTILAGDLNAVPWEPVVRRALRVGGLLDPRVGRGLYPTFDAQSWWMAWPLDQVLYQDSLGLAGWDVLPAFGSDHHPVLAELCLDAALAERQEAPAPEPGDLEAAERTMDAARLLAR